MTILRSRRLELLLGTEISNQALAWEHLERLREAQVAEAADLDYKVSYGTQPSDRHKPGGDVAAMANTQGGLIIVGADEKDAQLTSLPGIDLSDREHTRLLSLVGDHVHPYAEFEVIPVPNPHQDGKGCYVIAIPRSPRFPHGVLINEGYRWPRRVGHRTFHMSEAELASAYRARFARETDQASRADTIEHTAQQRLLSDRDGAWIMVSLVPDLPGDMVVNWDTFTAFSLAHERTDPVLLSNGSNAWKRIMPGPRCLLLDRTVQVELGEMAEGVAAELHTDGAGVFALWVPDLNRELREETDRSLPCRIAELWLMVTVLSGLRFLAHYARDYAYAGGDALIRAAICNPSQGRRVELSTDGAMGPSRLGTLTRAVPIPIAERAAPLDGLASDGPRLVSAAAYLVGDLMRTFGHPDVLHITTEGQVAPTRWWGHTDAIKKWAIESGVETL